MSRKINISRFLYEFVDRIESSDELYFPDDGCFIYELCDGRYELICKVIYGEN